jgi:hypothetical protein
MRLPNLEPSATTIARSPNGTEERACPSPNASLSDKEEVDAVASSVSSAESLQPQMCLWVPVWCPRGTAPVQEGNIVMENSGQEYQTEDSDGCQIKARIITRPLYGQN